MKTKLLASIAVLLGTLSINAQAAGGYVGVGVGQSHIDFDDSGLNAVTRDDKDTAYKVFGGFQFNKNFAAELGYVDFGKLQNVYNVNGSRVNFTGDVDGFYLAAVGMLPLSEQFSVFAKLGVTTNHSSATASASGVSSSASGSKSSAVIGIGAEYSFNKNISVAAEYEDFGKAADDVKLNLLSASLRYKF